MPRGRKPPAEFIADITVPDDGIRPFRKAHQWSRDKLGILASYLQAFATATSKKSRTRYFVDGMAGPGLYRFDDGTFVLGSTLIALSLTPAFTKCLAVEMGPRHAHALTLRTKIFGERAVVRRGDCNVDLIPLMREHIPPRGPAMVFLDPEGYELAFSTIAGVAGFRIGKKVELLILINTGSLVRTIAGRLQNDTGPWALDWAVPFDWREMAQRYKEGDLSADALREEAASRFCDALKTRLHYKHAFARQITRSEPGQAAIYHLAFASDDDTGARIMRDVFDSMWSNVSRGSTADNRSAAVVNPQLPLF